MENVLDRVYFALKGLDVKCNVPLSTLTSFHIGGPAAMVLRPHGAEDIRRAIQACSQFGCPYCVLGNGTNVLAPDAGYRGVVVRIDTPLTAPLFVDTSVTCASGTALSVLARESVNAGLMGMETLSGIPGTVGGAVAMNAGAYGAEVRHIIKSVRILKNGRVLTWKPRKPTLETERANSPRPAASCFRQRSSSSATTAAQKSGCSNRPGSERPSSRFPCRARAAYSNAPRDDLPAH
jgi:UDP-N-acetylenolpyruvoylglucosamine reductase